MIIMRRSPFSKKIIAIDLPITQDQLDRWEINHELIQDVFPDLTASEREFLMTGYTEEDWEKMFPSEE